MEEEDEGREDLKSILPFLPLISRSNLTLFWPPQAVEALKTLSQGPLISNVNSGDSLFVAISNIRNSLTFSISERPPLSLRSARLGYALFFDDLISRADCTKWFEEVVPALANLLLRFPSLLESHYQNSDILLTSGRKTGLRLLGPQQEGIVFLSQELIGAILACSFFCLFPVAVRYAKQLPIINFNYLFESLYDSYSASQENKIKCIIHYFGRICSCMPRGFVSFERKVLPLEQHPLHVSYPKADFWSESEITLCPLKVCSSGFIEDQSDEALEVDFANRYLGGGALKRGCVQEEIRFMINPELIAGMLFLPCMEDNEAIEIVGAERFSNYTGYASSFRFSGNHMDNRDFDSLRRRKTKLIAIDALSNPGMRQYELKCLLRETNKAFCGFLDHSKFDCCQILFQDNECQEAQNKKDHEESRLPSSLDKAPPTSVEIEITEEESISQNDKERIGVVTGNWGCGAFGGDPELKTIIQWLAASQALRPYILYYTFGIEALQNLDQVSQWILSHGWTVGELWNMLLAYSSQRRSEAKNVGFFTWLLPQSLDDTDMSLKQDF